MTAAERRAAWALSLAVLAAHGASLLNDFALDDLFYIVHNAAVANGRWTSFFVDRFALASDPGLSSVVYRPLQGAVYALNAALTGPGPLGFHAFDLALHVANSWLLFRYLSRRFGAGAGAWAGSLLFALHPAQVQSVAYASARCGPLSVFFGLLALLAASGPKGAPGRSTTFYGLSLLSKESGIAWLPVLAADAWIFGPRRPLRQHLGALAPHLAATTLYLAVRATVLGRVAQRGPWDGSWPAHALVAGRALLEDFGIATLAVPLREPHGFAKGPGYAAAATCGLALYLALGAAGAWGTWKRRPWGLGAVWFWSALLPVSQLVPFSALAADRFLHAPLGGAAVVVAAALSCRRFGRAWAAAGLVLTVMLATACVEGHFAWRNSFTLALHAHSASGGEPYAGLRLSQHYLNARMFDRVEALIPPALAPDQLPDVRRLGLRRLSALRLRQGRAAEAAEAQALADRMR